MLHNIYVYVTSNDFVSSSMEKVDAVTPVDKTFPIVVL